MVPSSSTQNTFLTGWGTDMKYPKKQQETVENTIDIGYNWRAVVYDTLRTLPYTTPAGRVEAHDRLLAIGAKADRFVALRALMVKELETVKPFEGPTGVLMERDGIAYRAVWVPVGGLICNTLTPAGGEE